VHPWFEIVFRERKMNVFLSALVTAADEARAALAVAEDIQGLYLDPEAARGGVLIRSRGLDDLVRIEYGRGRISVNFAGTRNLKQWLSNFDDVAFLRTLPCGVRVHAGAWQSMLALEMGLTEALRGMGAFADQDGHVPVDVGGHSRGGLLALEFVRVFGSRLYVRDVVTLGSPRVGDAAHGRDVLRHVHGRVLRWTHNNDPVVVIPPAWRGYRHIGELRHIDRRGRVHGQALGFFSGAWDGLAGRAAAVLDRRVLDGTDDHRLPTGYLPMLKRVTSDE
jgi:hypothetical protein